METTKELIFRIVSYSTSPGPRYCDQGDDSGEDFYHKILNAEFYHAYQNKMILTVDLDGPEGYASSFLDEAFGNLVYDFGEDVVNKLLKIKSDEEPEWKDMLYKDTFKEWSKRRKEKKDPKITEEHDGWYRLTNNKIERKQWIHSCSGK